MGYRRLSRRSRVGHDTKGPLLDDTTSLASQRAAGILESTGGPGRVAARVFVDTRSGSGLGRLRVGLNPHPRAGGAKEKTESKSRVTGGPALFSGSIRVVAWGIFVLLSAVSIVELGFGMVVIVIIFSPACLAQRTQGT